MTVSSTITPSEPGPGFLLELDELYPTDPDDLWQAVTTPDRLARFMATYRGEFRLGGHWQAFTVDGALYCEGEVTACERPRGFTTTWQVVAEQPTLLTVTLEPEGEGTRLRLRHEHVTRLDYGPGWHTYLESLAWHLADPGAAKDRERFGRRFAELEPGYAARFAALGAGPEASEA